METATASDLLRQARLAVGLTQRDLGDLAHCSQSTIGRLETSTHDVRTGTLSHLLGGLRYRLISVPTARTPVAELALAVRDALDDRNEKRAFRLVIQIADDLAATHGVERVVLAAAPPPPTGDLRYDAVIAGVAEHRLLQENLPIPDWARRRVVLDEPWVVSPYLTVADTEATTPEPLKARGVFIDADDLESV